MTLIFQDLMELPYNRDHNIIDMSVTELGSLLPHIPSEVIQGVFLDHGRAGHMQAQYGNIAIDQLQWECVMLPAEKLIEAHWYDGFDQVEVVGQGVACYFESRAWACIHRWGEHWKQNKTWVEAPFFIKGALLNADYDLHLMEGHTRLGTLIGLVKCGALSLDSYHKIWLAS